jgi:hypothetical protein
MWRRHSLCPAGNLWRSVRLTATISFERKAWAGLAVVLCALVGMEPEQRSSVAGYHRKSDVHPDGVTEWRTHTEGAKITSLARGWAVFAALRTEVSVSWCCL